MDRLLEGVGCCWTQCPSVPTNKPGWSPFSSRCFERQQTASCLFISTPDQSQSFVSWFVDSNPLQANFLFGSTKGPLDDGRVCTVRSARDAGKSCNVSTKYLHTSLPQWDYRNLPVCAAQGGQREQHASHLSGTTTAWLHCDTSKPSRQNHRSPSPRPGTLAASLGLRRHSRPRQPAPTARPALLPPPAAPAAPPPPPPPRDPARGRLPSSSRRQPRRPQRSSTRFFASRA